MNKDEYSLKKNDLGAIGIGAMIIFIALILVAAVASTIIIKTAEELQQRAQKTGDDTQDNLGGKILIQGAYVSEERAAGGTADEITIIVQLSSGSDTTPLSEMEWHMACDDGSTTASINAGGFDGVATDLDGTAYATGATVDAGETFLVPIDTSADCTPSVGDNQEMRVFISGGGDTYASLHYNDVSPGSSII